MSDETIGQLYDSLCGEPTSTPPLCARCDIAQDAAYERRADV